MINVVIERRAIREWISAKRQVLESAQATGSLARTKLDVKDDARQAFSNTEGQKLSNFNNLLEEELEAFCADMRLAAITVQQQVERRIPHTWRALGLALLAAFVTLMVTSQTVSDPGLGFGLPILVAIAVFFLAR